MRRRRHRWYVAAFSVGFWAGARFTGWLLARTLRPFVEGAS